MQRTPSLFLPFSSVFPFSSAFPIFPIFLLAVCVLLTACGDPPRQKPQKVKTPVHSEVITSGKFQPILRLWGTVEPAERVPLVAPAEGEIRYAARFSGGLRTGAEVRQGEELFRVESERLRLELAEAELVVRREEAELERIRRGVDGGFMSTADLDRAEIDAELAVRRLETTRLEVRRLRTTAPRSGTLHVERVIAPGTRVSSQAAIAEIAGEGSPRIEAWATASDLRRLETGLAVKVYSAGGGGELGQAVALGNLSEVAGEIDASGTVRLVVTIEEDLDLPPPGAGVDLAVELASSEAALTVPEEAMLIDGGGAAVFVLQPKGGDYLVQLRPIRVGSRADGRLEVLDGLREGDRIAVGGAEFLADGTTAVEAQDPEGGV